MAAAKTTKPASKSKPRAKKNKTTRRKYVAPLGVTIGAVGTAASAGLRKADSGEAAGRSSLDWMLDKSQTVPRRVELALKAAAANAQDLETYIPIAAGAVASAAPRLPIVKHIAKPLDKMIKAHSHGKWSA